MPEKLTSLTMQEGKPFRILQLTDIHLGGSIWTRKKDNITLAAVKTIIDEAKPDFIAITGDVAYPIFFWPAPLFGCSINNKKTSKKLTDLIESYNIPWAMVFGNHDCEPWSLYNKDKMADFYESLPNCVFQKGEYKGTDRGNYCIKLLNADGSLNNLLMFLDSNAYLTKYFTSGFDTIHDDQIEWYKETVIKNSPEGTVAPSLAFFHIPPKEFRDAFEKFYRGDKDVIYHCGFVQEKDNYFGYPKTIEGNFFNEMVKFGSLKGFFCGHDHLNTISLTYKGIQMTYGMSLDYLAYLKIKKWHQQRGGTIITINPDSSFNVELLPLEDIQGVSYYKTKM